MITQLSVMRVAAALTLARVTILVLSLTITFAAFTLIIALIIAARIGDDITRVKRGFSRLLVIYEVLDNTFKHNLFVASKLIAYVINLALKFATNVDIIDKE